MIVNLHNSPSVPPGVVVCHQAPDFVANKPEDYPITVPMAELMAGGYVRCVNRVFVFFHKDETGTLNYIYQEQTK